MHTLFSVLNIIPALLLLCLFSLTSCAHTPRPYTANGGTLQKSSPRRNSKLASTLRASKNSYFNRYRVRDQPKTPYSRRVGFRDLEINTTRQHRHRKPTTQVKQYSSFKSRFPDARNKLNRNAFRRDHAQSRHLEADTVPTKERQSSGGLSLDPCSTLFDCAATHFCAFRDDDGVESPCNGESSCVCLSNSLDDFFCSCAEPKCLPREICSGTTNPTCISLELDRPPIECPPGTGPQPPINGASGTGLSLEPCTTSSDCAGSHFCGSRDADDGGSISGCNGGPDCTCVADFLDNVTCSCREPECLPGELCGSSGDFTNVCVSLALDPTPLQCTPSQVTRTPSPIPIATPTIPLPTSPTPSPTPSPTDEVCIDAQALSHLQSHQLVYQHHAVSRVLCDKFGSCATPGHIVHFNGSAMMMKKYCEIAGCEERVMEVNSPRYKKGMRVASKTEGLEYTVFAARYETRGEEAVLAAAVRMGL